MTIDPKPDNGGNKPSEELVEMVANEIQESLSGQDVCEETCKNAAHNALSIAREAIEGPLLAKINVMLEKEGALPDMVNVEMMEENIALKAEIARLEEKFHSRQLELKRIKGKHDAYKVAKRCWLDVRRVRMALSGRKDEA